MVGLAAAWFLNRQLTFEIDGAGAGWPQIILSLLLLAAGIACVSFAIVTLLRSGTSARPDRPASRLVTEGPYRFSRNPIYLGFTAIYVGVAVLLNIAWPIILLPVVLITLTITAIEREERHLQETFGDAYSDYCRRVRRWI